MGQPVSASDDVNPKTRVGALKVPLHLVPPSATHFLALAFKAGADKYGPYNWREKKVPAMTYAGAFLRHFHAWLDGEDMDPETGNPHLAHAMACLAIVLDAESIGALIDDRPPCGGVPRLQREYSMPEPAIVLRD